MPVQIPVFPVQDWALIVEALVDWAGNPTQLETPRERRAWLLIEIIAADLGCTPTELIELIDDQWSGPEYAAVGRYETFYLPFNGENGTSKNGQ